MTGTTAVRNIPFVPFVPFVPIVPKFPHYSLLITNYSLISLSSFKAIHSGRSPRRGMERRAPNTHYVAPPRDDEKNITHY